MALPRFFSVVQPCETQLPSEWERGTPHHSGRKVQADIALCQAVEVSGVVEKGMGKPWSPWILGKRKLTSVHGPQPFVLVELRQSCPLM